jgi:hypothetical protein
MCCGWGLQKQGICKCLEPIGWTLGVNLDIAGVVAHPASELEGLRESIYVRTIPYPLHTAPNVPT